MHVAYCAYIRRSLAGRLRCLTRSASTTIHACLREHRGRDSVLRHRRIVPSRDRSRARSRPPAGCAAAPRDRPWMVCHATVMVASAKRGFGSDPPSQLPPASEVTSANIRAPRRTRSRSPHRRRRTLGRSLARPCRACAGKRSPCLPASASSGVQVEALGLIDTGRATGRSSIANNADRSLLQWGSEMSGASVLRTPPVGGRRRIRTSVG